MSEPLANFVLEIEGADDLTWVVQNVFGAERIHAPFRFDLRAQVKNLKSATIDLDDLVTRKAKLSWAAGDATRTVFAIVEEIACDADYCEITLVPRVALLADGADQKVFVNQDAMTIATSVLAARGITIDARVRRTPLLRAQCVQAFESDLAFVSRILAEEGIAWYVGAKEDVIVATDHAEGYVTIADPLPVVEAGAIVRHRAVFSVRATRGKVTEKVTLRDYNWKTPTVELEAVVGDGNMESYEFPGGFATTDDARVVAGLRLEERKAREVVLTGESTAREITPGALITIESESPDLNGDWLVVEVMHGTGGGDAGLGREPSVHFLATPKQTPFRPAHVAAPRMNGVQNAVTTGPAGQDLHTDPSACVKAQLRWDRQGKRDEKSSTWVRTLQPPTSGGFMLPRVGWEVLLGFCGGSADAPVVLGRLANGTAVPPEGLPGKKTMSAFGSLTTPGGGTKNLVRMNDAAGGEGFDVIASYDLNEKTENDKLTQVVGSESDEVGVNRKLIVGKVHGLTVKGSQTHMVGADRDVSVDANMQITATAETISIGALRTFKVGGDSTIGCATLSRIVAAAKIETAIEHQSRAVTGASTIVVGGSWNNVAGTQASVSVGGISTQKVGGPKIVKATKDYSLTVKGSLTQKLASRTAKGGSAITETYNKSATYTIDGASTMKGAAIYVVAKNKITLKADGVTVTITSDSVKIDGKFEGSVGAIDDGDESYA